MKITIRTKLLLASLSLLVLPWLGYRYIQGLEAYLRKAQEQQLLDRVAIMAAVMNGQTTPLTSTTSVDGPLARNHIYARPLGSPIQVDGYVDDWRLYGDRRQRLGDASHNQDLEVHYALGVRQEFLYLFFEVRDDRIVYRRPKETRADRSDHLRISLWDRDGQFKRYRLDTLSPGWVNAYLMPVRENDNTPQSPEPRIKAEWQEVAGGYDLEVRIPVAMIGGRFAVAIADVDDADTGSVENIACNGDTEKRDGLATIALPTAELDGLLQRLQRPMSRIWLVDDDYRVVALANNMTADDPRDDPYLTPAQTAPFTSGDIIRLFYRLLLEQPPHSIKDHLSSASRFDDTAVVQALAGEAYAVHRVGENHTGQRDQQRGLVPWIGMQYELGYQGQVEHTTDGDCDQGQGEQFGFPDGQWRQSNPARSDQHEAEHAEDDPGTVGVENEIKRIAD